VAWGHEVFTVPKVRHVCKICELCKVYKISKVCIGSKVCKSEDGEVFKIKEDCKI
jgi:hypothetical protein